jgi:hypothetical protein
MSPAQALAILPKLLAALEGGTKLTATQGPPCPGHPGFFLCPNKFSCAPQGGVCCTVGSCNAGTYCDKFVKNFCIGPGNPRFCAGTGNQKTGIALHCPPGKSCIAGPLCQ